MTLAFPARPAARRRRGADAPSRVGRPRLVWALPGVLFFALFALVPMFYSVYLSFTGNWGGIGSPHLQGAADWSRLISDSEVRQATVLSVEFTVVSWLFQTPIAMLLGVWAAGKQRNRAILSAIFFLPLVLSSAAIALLFKALLDPDFGLAKSIGPWIGFSNGNILGTPHGALIALIFVGSWQWMPFHTLLYQGGARSIPEYFYQAASIDGAGRVQQFRHITLPQLRHTITTSSMLILIGSFTAFELIFLLTNGGPGNSTFTLAYTMYENAFSYFNFGYASALGTALVVISAVISALLVRFTGFGNLRSTREGA